MTVFNLPDKDKLEIQMQKRIAELEKANQDLRAEILKCKKADETLDRERSLLKSVTQATDFMLAFFDPQFNFLWVNPAYAESCHMKPEEMVGKNHFVLYPHEENEMIFRKVRDTGKGVLYKDRPFIYPDQPERKVTYWDWNLTPVKDSGGNVTGLVLSLRETTKYKKAEEALRQAHADLQVQSEELQAANEELQVQSEELQAQTEELAEAYEALSESEKRYQLLFDHSLDAIILTDPRGNGKILSANPAACRMLGWSEEELIGKDRDVMFEPEDPALSSLLDKRARCGLARVQLTYRCKDGTKLIGELSTTLFTDVNGEPRAVAIIRDVTERNQIEEALRKSEERYRMLFTNMTEGFLIAELVYDKDGKPYDYRFLEVNHAYESIMGVKREQLLSKTVLEFFPTANSIAIKKFSEVAFSGKPMRFENFSHVANKYFEVYAFSPEKGKLAAIFRDITPRKEAEAKLNKTLDNLENMVKERTEELEKAYDSLKKSEKSLAEAQRMAHIGNWERNLVTGEVYCSDELYRVFGHKPQEFKIDYNIFLNFIHPSDRDYVNNAIEEALNGQYFSIDYRIITANGEERTVHSQGEVVFEENVPIRTMGTVQDITERKHLEEQVNQRVEELEMTMDVVPVAIFISHDPKGHNITGNKKANEYSEAGVGENVSASIVPGKRFFNNGRELTSEELPVQQAALKDIDVRNVEIDYVLPSGQRKVVLGSASPLHDSEGHVRGSVGAFIDITERTEAEEAIEKLNKLRTKEIHHRIKNNLQVICSLLSLEAERFSEAKVLEAFKESQNRVASMALIHEELYKGKGTDDLDFAAYIQKLTQELFSSYNLRNEDISLKLNLEQAYLGMDTAIPLGIIVNELISNSFKHAFSEVKEGEINVSLKKTEEFNINRGAFNSECNQGKFQYTLKVADNGIGIPEEISLEDADSLGLQLVSLLVEQIDGCIELKRDQGTEFTICFSDVEK